jgi:hypothetical protein
MRELLRNECQAMREHPVERLLKPGIKAAVIVAVLSVAAHWLSEQSSYDRKGLAQLAVGKAPVAASRRP